MKAETAGPLIMRFIRRALVCIITIPFLSLFLSLSLPLFPLSLTHSPTNSHSLQAYRFLVTLAKNLPTQSPLDKRWPRCSPLFKRTSFLLRKMYHGWRVRERGNSFLYMYVNFLWSRITEKSYKIVFSV